MALAADLYWSLRSPYSYLAIRRWRELVDRYDLEIAIKLVYPLAVRQPDFFERQHPNWLRYTMIDVARLAQFHGIALSPPRPDPVVQDMTTRRIATEQPYIQRLMRLGQAAARRGRGFVFADEVAQLIWGGTADWHQGDHLARAADKAGLQLADLEREASDDAAGLDEEVAANQAALDGAGHWGVPTLVFGGEPFFGQDRIELALWRMKQAGLAPR